MPHVSVDDPSLAAYVLGAADATTAEAIEAHLRHCAACRLDVDAVFEALGSLSEATVPPAPRLFSRIEGSVAHLERFSVHVPALGELLDLPGATVRGILHGFADDAWPLVPAPGVELSPLVAGPRRDGAVSVLARVQPGARIPRHRHVGPEHTFVLEGAFMDDDGGADAGELVTREGGVDHDVIGAGDVPCLAVIVMEGGLAGPAS